MSKKMPEAVLVDLINDFADSGYTETEAIVELMRDHRDNERHDKSDLDEESLQLLDSILVETIRAARAVRSALYAAAEWTGTPKEPFQLRDVYDANAEFMEGFIEVAEDHIGIGFAGYGVQCMEPDVSIVMVEQLKGKPRMHAYGDADAEGPTHTIELDGAVRKTASG